MEISKFIVAVILLTSSGMAADFCALNVVVTNSRSQPVATPVQLLDSAGKLVYEGIAADGKARICDFGLGFHRLIVGSNKCGQVTIGKVYLQYGYPLHLKVVLNECFGEIMVLGCPVYLRVAPAGAKPFAEIGVRLKSGTIKTDRYGRLWFLLPRGEQEDVEIQLDGYQPVSRSFACPELRSIAEEIVLQPR